MGREIVMTENTVTLGNGGMRATRENALNLIRGTFSSPNGYDAKHIVLLLWRGPISGELNSRSGGFKDYVEAQWFADGLAAKYSEMELPFAVYLNGELYKSKNEDKILDEEK